MKEPVTIEQLVDVFIAAVVMQSADTTNISATEVGDAIDEFLDSADHLYEIPVEVNEDKQESVEGARPLPLAADVEDEDDQPEEYDPDDNSKDH